MLSMRLAQVVVLALLPLACTESKPAGPSGSPSASNSAMSSAADLERVAAAVKQLGDPRQDVRDVASITVRRVLSENPAAGGERSEASWKEKLASIQPGLTQAQVVAATGAQPGAGVSSGQTSTVTLRLDDYWEVSAIFDTPDKLRQLGPLTRSARAVWVEPPPDYSGKWATYYVNGVMNHEIQYVHGDYQRFAAYYDNGQLTYEQRYVDGKPEGLEVGYHRNGTRAYELRRNGGKEVGRSAHWYPNGKLETEQTYVDGLLEGPSTIWRQDGTRSSRIDYHAGKETGQAAWDEKGNLLYARGTAEALAPKVDAKGTTPSTR